MWFTLKNHWFGIQTFVRRHWRQQPIAIIGIVAVIALAIFSAVWFLHLKKMHGVFRAEEPWTYLVFGLASVSAFVLSALILMNQTRREFGDSQELVHQLIDIIDDAKTNGGRLSILYPSPNVGQWDYVFRGLKGFDRFQKLLIEQLRSKPSDTKICMLKGSATDSETSLGKFIKAFHNATYVSGEQLLAVSQTGEESILAIYQNAADDFFAQMRSNGVEIRYIDDNWFESIVDNQLVILAAGHSLGFLGYMSLQTGEYCFTALPQLRSAGYLHGLFDALVSFYATAPVSGAGESGSENAAQPVVRLANQKTEGSRAS